jgi:hypothetical protein
MIVRSPRPSQDSVWIEASFLSFGKPRQMDRKTTFVA